MSNIAYAFHHEFDHPEPVEDYTRPLAEAVVDWRTAHDESALVRLDLDGGPAVVDTRPATDDLLIHLSEAEARVLDFCDKIQGLRSVHSFLEGLGEEDPSELVDGLRRRGLLLVLDGKALSLPLVTDTIPPMARAKLLDALAQAEAEEGVAGVGA